MMEIVVSSKGTEITTDMSLSQIVEFIQKWHQLWKPALPEEEGCTNKEELYVANFEPFPRCPQELDQNFSRQKDDKMRSKPPAKKGNEKDKSG